MNDAKKKILARRAQFVAAALAGLGADACHKEPAKRDASAEQAPVPCLSVPYDYHPEPVDAGAPVDAAPPAPDAAPAAPDASTKPPPPPPAPRPRPCLKIAPPKE